MGDRSSLPQVAKKVLTIRKAKDKRSTMSRGNQKFNTSKAYSEKSLGTLQVSSKMVGGIATEHLRSLIGEAQQEVLLERITDAMQNNKNIPLATMWGTHFYDFWQDAEYPKGVWRRSSLDTYLQGTPVWELLINLQDLCEIQQLELTWGDAIFCDANPDLVLIVLSYAGSTKKWISTYSLHKKSFVWDLFLAREYEGEVAWKDSESIWIINRSKDCINQVELVENSSKVNILETVFKSTRGNFISIFSRVLCWGNTLIICEFPEMSSGKIHVFCPTKMISLKLNDDEEIHFTHYGVFIIRENICGLKMGIYYLSFESIEKDEFEFKLVFELPKNNIIIESSSTKLRLLLVVQDLEDIVLYTIEADNNNLYTHRFIIGKHISCSIIPWQPEYSDDFFIIKAGFTTSPAIYHYNSNGKVKLLFSAPHVFDSTQINVEINYAKSKDDTLIPYYLVGKSSLTPIPTIIYGYGGFAQIMRPHYGIGIGIGWLEAGGQYVLACLRGGAEWGKQWHRAATRKNKIKTLEDVEAIALDLFSRGKTTADQLGFIGTSNGGLIALALLTRSPSMFGAIVAQSPIADLKIFPHHGNGHLWIEEFGDPDSQDWIYMKNISPVHNIKPVDEEQYPPVFILHANNDDVVPVIHSQKMVKALEDNGQAFIYFEFESGGHAVSRSKIDAADQLTAVYSFFRKMLRLPMPDRSLR